MPEVQSIQQQDFTTLRLTKNGTDRMKVSLRAAMMLKSTVSDSPTKEEVKIVLDACNGEPGVEYRKAYHHKEASRRRQGVFNIAKKEIIKTIGDRTFTIIDPAFREICSRHGYNPSSLAGTLVKYGFVDCIGLSRHITQSKNHSRYHVYRVKPQP
jgi:hypothetical protein